MDEINIAKPSASDSIENKKASSKKIEPILVNPNHFNLNYSLTASNGILYNQNNLIHSSYLNGVFSNSNPVQSLNQKNNQICNLLSEIIQFIFGFSDVQNQIKQNLIFNMNNYWNYNPNLDINLIQLSTEFSSLIENFWKIGKKISIYNCIYLNYLRMIHQDY